MAKAGTPRRRKRRWLRRLVVALLVVVALTGTAFGIVSLQIRGIVLSALRKELPNCEVSVGRVVLSPLLSLSVYDLKVEDRSRPESPSTITVERVTADVSIAALLKFDIALDVAAPAVALGHVSGDPPPFADLFERERKAPSDRFLVRRLDVRDGSITILDPGLAVSTTLQVELTSPPRGSTDEPTRLTVALEGLELEAGGVETAGLGETLELSLYRQPAEDEDATEISGTLRIARPGGESGPDEVLAGRFTGRTGAAGTRVRLELDEHELGAVLGLWRTEGRFRVAGLGDLEALAGTVKRVVLAASYDSASGGGLSLEGEFEAAGLGAKLGSPAEAEAELHAAVTVGALEGAIGYGGASDGFFVREFRARDCTVDVRSAGVSVSTRLDLGVENWHAGGNAEPGRVTAVLDGFEFGSGGVRTVPLRSSFEAVVAGGAPGSVADVSGTFAIGHSEGEGAMGRVLAGEFKGRTGPEGTQVALELDPHEVEAVLGLCRTDGGYRVPVVGDLDEVAGTVKYVTVAASYDSGPGRGLSLEAEIEAEGLGAKLGGPADGEAGLSAALKIGGLTGALGYGGESEGFFVQKLRARECAVDVRSPGLAISTTLDLGAENVYAGGAAEPGRVTATLDKFDFATGGLRTVLLRSTLDLAVDARAGEDAVDVRGAMTIGRLKDPVGATLTGAPEMTGEIEGRIGAQGTRVAAEFGEHGADVLLGLLRRDGAYKIGFLHDFEKLTGTVDRLGVVVLSGPAVAGGMRIEGEIEAKGLDGRSGSMKMEVEGMTITEPVVLAAPPGGGPMALSVGDPTRKLDPGRITAKRVTFQKYAATDVSGTLWMRDNNWTLDGITGTLYGGKGAGSIRALAGGTLEFKLAFDDVDLEPVFATVGREGDKVTGRAKGAAALTVGRGGVIEAIEGHLKTKPPGGRIKIKDADDLLKEAPGGEQVYEAITQGLPSKDPESFFEKFKDFNYETVEIGTEMSGKTFVTTLHVKERAARDPLELEIKFNYIREVIEH